MMNDKGTWTLKQVERVVYPASTYKLNFDGDWMVFLFRAQWSKNV